ncbi:unnamed protein product [Polarella glacialis]|uniref:Uncharacterized protein n=1 Tax=Polarella glacialis TaxID=89957 RepID=A0A813GCJ9_POLGL|nr:unnamed protein product [Polarella glacialis]CAE8655185.1 unnamed protein product [Polarella glacialis]
MESPASDESESPAHAGGTEDEEEEEEESEGTFLFNDWGPDPDRAAEQQASALQVTSRVLWELPEVSLGPCSLHHFGPNGPPMNVMDVCPVTHRLFIANQRQLFGFSIAGLTARALGSTVASNDFAGSVELGAQVNRIRCGQLAGRPVVVAVDSRGGVAVVPTNGRCTLEVAQTLQNSASQWGEIPPAASGPSRGTSTWGIGLQPHGEPAGDEGTLLVTGNDHCVKAWWLRPSPTACQTAAEVESDTHTRSCAGHLHSSTERWKVREYLSPQGLPPTGGNTTGCPHTLLHLSENLPGIDLAQGHALVASLDGSVTSMEVCPPPAWSAAQTEHGASSSALSALEENRRWRELGPEVSLGRDVGAGEGAPAGPPLWHTKSTPPWRHIFAPRSQHLRRTWNACWIPLRSIRCVDAPPLPKMPPDIVLEWGGLPDPGATLSGEIVKSSVLPLLTADELLMVVQLLSMAHAPAARAEVAARHRIEQMALIFSENDVWLVDSCLGARCRQTLPFQAAFAHVSYMPEASTAFIAPKMARNANPIWAVTVLRRARSLRFRLQVQALPHELPDSYHDVSAWPLHVPVGLASGTGGQLFTLRSSHRLTCLRVALEDTSGT